MGLNHAYESKVMAVWICLLLPFSISSISMYNAPKSNIHEKRYDHWNFLRASVVIFWASRYIMGLNHTPESKVMVVWIYLVLPCLILSLSICYGPDIDIRVKSHGHFNLPRAFLFKFERLDIWQTLIIRTSEKLWPFEFAFCFLVQFLASQCIMGLNRTFESKFMTVWISWELPLLNFERSIYHGPQSYTESKVMAVLNLPRAFLFKFERLDILLAWIGHSSQRLLPFEFSLCIHV